MNNGWTLNITEYHHTTNIPLWTPSSHIGSITISVYKLDVITSKFTSSLQMILTQDTSEAAHLWYHKCVYFLKKYQPSCECQHSVVYRWFIWYQCKASIMSWRGHKQSFDNNVTPNDWSNLVDLVAMVRFIKGITRCSDYRNIKSFLHEAPKGINDGSISTNIKKTSLVLISLSFKFLA